MTLDVSDTGSQASLARHPVPDGHGARRRITAPPSAGRGAAALGGAGAVLLVVSLALPYWRARLFAPQYSNGLTASMYAFMTTGDVQEINELNHYIGMRKLEVLAVAERWTAIPVVLGLAALGWFAFRTGTRVWRRAAVVAGLGYPVAFVADFKLWMWYSTTHLDPTAPIKLKPFSIPVLGTGQIAQFRSEFFPMPGFYLALTAAVLFLVAYLRSVREADPPQAGGAQAGGTLAAIGVGLMLVGGRIDAEPLQPLLDAAVTGGVVQLGPGRYEGPAVVTRPMTLRGGPGAVVTGRERGTVLTVRAPGVVLEDMTIGGSGDSLLYEDAGVRLEAPAAVMRRCEINDVLFGVFLVQAPDAVIEDNVFSGKPIDLGRRGDLIRGWNSDRMSVRRNRLEGGRDFVLWFSNGSVVEDNTMEGGRYGLHFMYTNGAEVRNNRFARNSVGFYVMYSHDVVIAGNRFEHHRGPSGAGLGLKESEFLTVTGNVFAGNRQGIYIDNSPLVPERTNVFTCNTLVHNDIGLAMLPGVAGNVFTDNAFDDNLQQISERGGGVLSGNQWERDGRGNFWSDYAGYGSWGGETGRVPYKVESAWEGLMDRQPLARFFQFTPAAEAVELACRAFPIFRPKAVLTDEHPLLRPPAGLETDAGVAHTGWGLPVGFGSLCGLWLGLPGLARRRRVHTAAVASGEAPAVVIRGLGKSFGDRTVLSGVDLTVRAGQTVVLWGANGAGKSTLIKCVLGLYDGTGSITIFGHDVRTRGEAARAHMAHVAQEHACYDWSVQQAMAFVARLRGIAPGQIGPALDRCGLAAHAAQRVTNLSGGMKQKLALAQALLSDPPLLLLDEPCSNLDTRSRREFLGILERLKGTRAILMTSHRAEEVERLADVVLWLEEGETPRLMDRTEFRLATRDERPTWLDLDRTPHPEAVG